MILWYHNLYKANTCERTYESTTYTDKSGGIFAPKKGERIKMMGDRYLIINADDFGMCHAHNAATVELFKCGGITSATIMTPCPAAREAAEFAARNPQLSIGVHLTTTAEWKSYRWGPVSGEARSLTDTDGFFYGSSARFAAHARIDEVERELIAQIETLHGVGVTPSHIDNHMGSLYGVASGDFSLLTLTLNIAGRYGLPFRFPTKIQGSAFSNGTLDIKIPELTVRRLLESFVAMAKEKNIPTPDYLVPGDWNGAQDESFDSYKEYMFELLRTIENGVSETYIHPAIECEEIKLITPNWHRRVWEHRLFSDSKTKEFINSLGIKTIGYRELDKMRRQGLKAVDTV